LIKNLVKNGLIANMNVEEVKTNHPAFEGFGNSCISNKLSNLKSTFNEHVDKRGKSKLSMLLFQFRFPFWLLTVLIGFSQWTSKEVVAWTSKHVPTHSRSAV